MITDLIFVWVKHLFFTFLLRKVFLFLAILIHSLLEVWSITRMQRGGMHREGPHPRCSKNIVLNTCIELIRDEQGLYSTKRTCMSKKKSTILYLNCANLPFANLVPYFCMIEIKPTLRNSFFFFFCRFY